MIIREIYIDGFGIFNGFSIKNLDKGINILFGENEAGKSTLLKFFKYTLFGYPRFKDQRMPPVFGGSHGGRIKTILSTNKEVVFERKGDDKIALFYDGNTSGNETQWLQFLGNATKDIYENVFAFSLDELLGIGSLSVSGVEDKIFSIGSGMGKISIGEIINDIQSNTDQIYSQRGSKQIIPLIHKSIQDKKAEIKLIQENLPKYQELTSAIRDLKKEITDLENKIKEDRNRKGKLDDYLKCYESFVSVVKTDEELAGLPEPHDYPKTGPEKLKELEKEEKSLNDRIDELMKGNAGDQGIGEIEKELESISFNSEILAEKAKVNYLKTNLEKYKQTISDRSEDRGKIIDLDSIILEKLKAINPDWTRQDIIDFSNLITHQDRIKTFKEDLDKIKNEKIELKGRKEGMLANASRINPGNALILISLVFLLASVPAFYYSLYVPAIICVVIALLIFFGRRYLMKEDPVIKIDEELSEVENKGKKCLESYWNYLEKELNLERNLSADSVLEILNATGHLKKDIGERDDLDKKQKEMRDPFIKDFENTAKSIGYLLRNKEADSGIETLIIQITDEFDFAESQSKRQNELEDSLSRKKKELERNRNNLTRNNQLVSDLLKSVNAVDIDDFRKKYEVNSNVLELIQKKRTAINTIETIAGINMANDVIDFLKTNEQAALR